MNRLGAESSPYLLQHASNPVDWYPWGDEAFSRAEAEDKPVFLSIGYSACHWCHVMERESFADPEAAALLNAVFVCIKVDREERPDVDAAYMAACRALTGGGGWPLTLLLTPGRRPFFAATYLPKTARFGREGLMDLAARARELWRTRRVELSEAAERVQNALRDEGPRPGDDVPGRDLLERAYRDLKGSFDPSWGGFGDAPKFPMPHALRFLLRHHHRFPGSAALSMVRHTLDAMRAGGIYDQLGGGFHRYATDARWRVPHFEKMLGDQALLSLAYTEAWQVSGEPAYRATVEETLDYVLRDLAGAEGGFYCAEDADSEGEEGKYYKWTRAEILQVLGAEAGGAFCRLMNVEAGAGILFRSPPKADDPDPAEVDAWRRTLLAARALRVRPGKDDKVLTDWNGLAIAAFARAGRAMGEPRYIAAAERAAAFITSDLTALDGTLLHRWRAGGGGVPGFLDDYAFFILGLLELHAATWKSSHLRTALALAEQMAERLGDPEEGGYFMSAPGPDGPGTRIKTLFDGALPSGNSAAMDALLRLAALTGWSDLADRAWTLARLFAPAADRSPSGFAHFLSALDFGLGPSCEVVVAGRDGAPDTRGLLGPLERGFHPRAVALFKADGASAEVDLLAPFAEPMGMINGNATAYICVGNACGRPLHAPSEMVERIEGIHRSGDGRS